MLRPANAQRVISMLGLRRKISYIPLAIVIATSITAPSEPTITDARKIVLGGNVKKLMVSNFMPAPSVACITPYVIPIQRKVPNSVLIIVTNVRQCQPVMSNKVIVVDNVIAILIKPNRLVLGNCK